MINNAKAQNNATANSPQTIVIAKEISEKNLLLNALPQLNATYKTNNQLRMISNTASKLRLLSPIKKDEQAKK